jgi:protein-tyrosine phosphatase
LGEALEIVDWLPNFPGAGVRLVSSFWPGPLTVVCGTGLERGLFRRLPVGLGNYFEIQPFTEIGFRLASHDAVRVCSRWIGTPLLALETFWKSAQEITAACSDKVALIIQDDPSNYKTDTLVRLDGREWQMVREGAITSEQIKQAAPCRILFVCTGNTCRSPMAERLCGKLLADKVGCRYEELFEHGFFVQSAGLAAMMGERATPEAVDVVREFGVDLADHVSQPLSVELLQQSDIVIAMTASHLRVLRGFPGLAARLLSADGVDVADPIGGTPEVYRACARQIKSCLEDLVPEFLEC